MILNMVVNAVDVLEEGGTLTLDTMPVTKDGNDLYPVYNGKEPNEIQEDGHTLADGKPCPVWCDD